MTAITVRKIDDQIKSKLRIRAARNGRSMEEEAREILKSALISEQQGQPNLAESIRRRFEPLGGVELSIPPREPVRRPPTLR